ATENVSPAGALDDPMLMVQLWNTPVDFSAVPVMVQLSQTIPLAGKRGARTDAARAEAAFAESDLAVKQRDIETALASAYFELFLADRTQEVDDELETILKVLLLSSESRVSSGKGEQSELLRAQASLVQLRSNRESALDHKRSSSAPPASRLVGAGAHRCRRGVGAGAAQPDRGRGRRDARAPRRRRAPDRSAPSARPPGAAGAGERAVELRGRTRGFRDGAGKRARAPHARAGAGDAPRRLRAAPGRAATRGGSRAGAR